MTAQDDPGTIVKTSGCLKHGQNSQPCAQWYAAALSVYRIVRLLRAAAGPRTGRDHGSECLIGVKVRDDRRPQARIAA